MNAPKLAARVDPLNELNGLLMKASLKEASRAMLFHWNLLPTDTKVCSVSICM